MIKTFVIPAAVALVVALGVVGLVGNQTEENLGAVTRMPNVDLVAKSITASTTVTTATGTIFITTKSPTQGGQIIVRDGDGDGCSAISANGGTVVGRTITCP